MARTNDTRSVAVQRTADVMRAVLEVASTESGATRGLIADRMGVRKSTVDHWCRDASDALWPAWALFTLLSDETILGTPATLMLAQRMLKPGGLGVHALCGDQADDAGGSVGLGLLGALGRFGALSDGVRDALADGSIDANEARRVTVHIDQVIASLQSVREQLGGVS
ncbi:MAG: hypothetical protein AAF235_07900 [Planctomycetota bacterium]